MKTPVFATSLSLMLAASAAMADRIVPEVSDVSMWQSVGSRKVNITYTLANAPAIVIVDICTNGISIGDANFHYFTGDCNKVVQPGANKRVTWQSTKAWPGHEVVDNAVTAKIYAWPLDNPPDYMVADLIAVSKAYVPFEAFAYPNCRCNDETDALFREKGFEHVRGGVKGATPYDPDGVKQADRKPLVANDAVVFPASELTKRFRIDTIIVGEAYHTDIDEICACLRRAAERREVLSITSHDIAPDAGHIHMKVEWLETILATAFECGLAIIGFDELPHAESVT